METVADIKIISSQLENSTTIYEELIAHWNCSMEKMSHLHYFHGPKRDLHGITLRITYVEEV